MMQTDSGIKIKVVRISNFRSLNNIEVRLEDLTIFVGANNAGKTSFLDALHAAIGVGRKLFGKEDIHITMDESDAPKERKAVIDLFIHPTGKSKDGLAQFPQGSFWTGLWGKGISQDDDFNDFIAIRTSLAWRPAHGEYRIERKFLKEWKSFDDWLSAEEKDRVSSVQLEPMALHYIDAKRDIEEDLRAKGSFWSRLTNDLGLSESDISQFEQSLSHINQQIIGKSSVLKHLHQHLTEMKSVVPSDPNKIAISPVARHLRDLSKGVDVTFATNGAQSFPLSRHGMGTRSLASLMVFHAFTSWKYSQTKKEGHAIHTMLALEEPESHLHPQAQRSLFAQIKAIPGQRIVSTHSPYFAGQAELEQLRLFQKEGDYSTITQLDASRLTEDDRRKLEQTVVLTRGDIFFARALVLFEGQTEEQAFPIWAQAYWGASIHELGFSFVSVGGTDYYPFVWLANSLGVSWYIFSDGEDHPVSNLKKGLERAGLKKDLQNYKNIIILPNGNDFEKQLIEDGYLSEVEKAFNEMRKTSGTLDNYIKKNEGEKGKRGIPRDYLTEGGRERAAIDLLRENKTQAAIPVAAHITQAYKLPRSVPQKVLELFQKISQDLGLTQSEEES